MKANDVESVAKIKDLSRLFKCIAKKFVYLLKSNDFNIGTSLPNLRSLLAVPPE